MRCGDGRLFKITIMSHHRHSNRRSYSTNQNHNGDNRPHQHENETFDRNKRGRGRSRRNSKSPWRSNGGSGKRRKRSNSRGRGRGRGKRGRFNSNRGRGRGRGRYNNHHQNEYQYDDISHLLRREMSVGSAVQSAGTRSINARYKPGGSEYEGTGTATPAQLRYLLHQRHENTTTPVYGLSQHEAPDPICYPQIEAEYQSFLHELNITSNYPRLPYKVREEKDKVNVIHFGQLKLLLSEIRFLTEYNEMGKVIVYAGAAPGHHIGYLADMFPEHRFELYDPCEFSKSLEGHSRISCHREYFTNSLAERLGNEFGAEGVLFISDIRTADHRQMTEEENERCILKDNEWQKQWVQAMRPKKAMLKFRCPYPDRIPGTTQYLDGQIWIQSFNRRSGTETRLIPIEGDDCSYTTMREYDHIEYEEKLFFFNEKVRCI